MVYAHATGEAVSEVQAVTPPSKRRKRVRASDLPAVYVRCKGCGVRFPLKKADQFFHDTECARAWWQLARRRGGMVYELLCKMRRNRKVKGGTKGILSDISHIVDGWLAEDREIKKRKAKSCTP